MSSRRPGVEYGRIDLSVSRYRGTNIQMFPGKYSISWVTLPGLPGVKVCGGLAEVIEDRSGTVTGMHPVEHVE